MLIRFTVENFRSFNEESVFSMLPGRTKTHSEHIMHFPEPNINAVRVALIYGANASGKSNLIKAMEFVQNFIVIGRRPKQSIPIVPFRLRKARAARQPSRFEFEFTVNGQVYAYGFVVNGIYVYDEWLYLVNARNEKPLFERTTNEKKNVIVSFTHAGNVSDTDKQFLDFVGRSTRSNQLLLTTLAEHNVSEFEPIYNWFRNTLTIIFPKSYARNIQVGVHGDQQFSQKLTEFLHTMNTGIDEVCTKPVDLDSVDFPMDMIVEDLDRSSEESGIDKCMVLNGSGGRYLVYRNSDGLIEAYILTTKHHIDGTSIEFDLFEESDGTQRLFDLFPILHGAENRVYVVDELERSLHPNLVRQFIENFLEINNRSQLIFTTHESTILDSKLLRRDAIWFVEKSQSGASSVYSLEEFKTRNDLDIRKGYLHGRFGAIPVFGSSLHLGREES